MKGYFAACVFVIFSWTALCSCAISVNSLKDEPKQKWNYVSVREHAHMFWWLYYTAAPQGFQQVPLVLWLQGGPGGSSTGFGNFGEIGPLDANLKERSTSWVSQASVLFVDNPVGAGYSYVTDDSAYTTDVHMIAQDLLTLIEAFYSEVAEFQKIPFYIFSESYGGKMTAAFSQVLNKAIQAGEVKCNFKGFAMGDSWISPVDSVMTWGPYLFTNSLVDEPGLAAINKTAYASKVAFDKGNYAQSTHYWSLAENVIENKTSGVNFYNILEWQGEQPSKNTLFIKKNLPAHLRSLYERHVGVYYTEPLADLMNGPIREKLGIIPKNVTWGAQSGMVFQKQAVDFMKPVIDIVDDLLINTELSVVVYNGQLDLIVDTPGTELWVQKLSWPGLPSYNTSPRKPVRNKDHVPLFFSKHFKNFSFYWILDAGHMVPSDAGEAAIEMLHMVISG